MQTINKRISATYNENFVVFIIGMRINRWWKIGKWFSVLKSMPKMLSELSIDKESGFLGYEARTFSRSPLLVQYWKSFEHLEQYARDTDKNHYPAWKSFNKIVGQNGDVGIWHETYVVAKHENIYVNMPPTGLGKFGIVTEVKGAYNKAAVRLEKRES